SQCYNIEDFTSSISLSSHLLLINQSPFTFFAWQLVFILGLFVGERIANRKSLPVLSNRMQLIPLLIVVVGTCWSHGILQMSLPQNLLLFLINKSTEGVFRIFELVSFVYLIHFAMTNFPKIFRTKWLIFIGQNSLAFYVTHIFVLYLLAPLRNTWHLEWTRWVQISATFVVILILTFSVWSFSVLRKLRYSFNKPINGNN
nr:OpgC domain-containing protein [Pseudomonadota bacterium]